MRSPFSAKPTWLSRISLGVIGTSIAVCLVGGSSRAQVLNGWQPDVQSDQAVRKDAPLGSAQQPAVAGNATAKPPSNGAEHPVRPSSNEQNELLPEEAAKTSEGRAKPQAAEPDMSLARQYCRVVGNDAFAAKLAEERRRAEDLKRRIEAKIGELEAATAEQKRWLQLRKEFQEKATGNLVAVYALMDAEAAAQRLTDVTDDVAAAILLKLPPKATSAILAEMQSDKAGRLTAYLAGSADVVGSPATIQATP